MIQRGYSPGSSRVWKNGRIVGRGTRNFHFMKNIILSFLLLSMSVTIYGQVGVSSGFQTFVAEEWTDLLGDITGQNFDQATGFNVGIDYWMRLKEKRVEFLPELNYSSHSTSSGFSEIDVSLLGIHLNTNIYPFDFAGDCDCPTWSKSGGIFEKGFFLQVSPGFNRGTIKVEDEIMFEDENFSYFNLAVGAGLDIGLSDFLTITPIVRYRISPSVEYIPTNNSPVDFGPVESNIKQFYAGVRLGFRFDE